MQPKKAKAPVPFPPAPYPAEHMVYRLGKDPETNISKGDLEVAPSITDNDVLLTVGFDDTDGKGCRQGVTLKLNPKDARDLAYALLLQAND